MRQNGGSEPDMTDIMEHLRKKARDHARTPMQVRIVRLPAVCASDEKLYSGTIRRLLVSWARYNKRSHAHG
jgi:hypothetical protein